MKMFRIVLTLLLGTQVVQAQQVTLKELNEGRNRVQTTSMGVLSGWAVANLAYSGIAASQTSGSTRYFNRMNVYWNVVNLGIAAPSLIGSLRQRSAPPATLAESVEQLHSLEKVLLLNTGLDVAYVMGGLYLLERAKSTPSDQDRSKGFGQSVLLQGGFLLLFDAASYAALRKSHRRAATILKNVQFTGQSLGIVHSF